MTPPTPDLFADPLSGDIAVPPRRDELAPGAVVLGAFASEVAAELLAGIAAVTAAAPFRHMRTPGGFVMSVAMSNCGSLGWTSDPQGYRYSPLDPDSGRPWPPLPPVFRDLAGRAAAAAGFVDFVPDACLINRYEPGARLTLHQDRDEHSLAAPIVAVSLGLPATFLFGGMRRRDPVRHVPLGHGDVVVWGGPARLRYHGVLALADGEHSRLGRQRISLSFRRAG